MDKALKKERSKRKTIQTEKLWETVKELLTRKETLGIAGTLAAFYLIPRIPWSSDKDVQATSSALLTAIVVLISLGQAGVGDTTCKEVALGLGVEVLFAKYKTAIEAGLLVGAGVGAWAFISSFIAELAPAAAVL